MGFADSIAGLGRALVGGIKGFGSVVGDIFETGVEVLGPPLLTAGAQALFQQLIPGGTIPQARGAVPQPIRASNVLGFDPRLLQQPFPAQPVRQALPFLPQTTQPRPTQFGGFQQVSSFPSGGVVPGVSPASFQIGGAQSAAFDLPFIDIVPQGVGQTFAALSSPFRPTMAGAAANTFVVPNPVTGRATWFKPAGRPLIWSADLVACRRVGKLAARARRVTGRRRPR